MQRDYMVLSILFGLTSLFFGVWQGSVAAGLFCFFMIATCDEMFH